MPSHAITRAVLVAFLALGVGLGAAACETVRDEDTTELRDESEEREEQVDEGVNQGVEDED